MNDEIKKLTEAAEAARTASIAADLALSAAKVTRNAQLSAHIELAEVTQDLLLAIQHESQPGLPYTVWKRRAELVPLAALYGVEIVESDTIKNEAALRYEQ